MLETKIYAKEEGEKKKGSIACVLFIAERGKMKNTSREGRKKEKRRTDRKERGEKGRHKRERGEKRKKLEKKRCQFVCMWAQIDIIMRYVLSGCGQNGPIKAVRTKIDCDKKETH